MLEKYDVFVFDLDGTLYRGDRLIPNSIETINMLQNLGKQLLFISNKTTGTIRDYYNILYKGGADVELNQFVNSTIVLLDYMNKYLPASKFYAVGEKSFIDQLESEGFYFTDNPDEVEIVIVTLDRTFNFAKLEIAAKALENGAKFFAANIDDTCPVENGEIIDAGTIISALEKRTHIKLDKHFGKPSKFMMDLIESKSVLDRSKTLIIGDRLETDIAMGNIFGIDSALVLSGIKNFENGNKHIKPTYEINQVSDLLTCKLEK